MDLTVGISSKVEVLPDLGRSGLCTLFFAGQRECVDVAEDVEYISRKSLSNTEKKLGMSVVGSGNPAMYDS